jgi:hypothetical protein
MAPVSLDWEKAREAKRRRKTAHKNRKIFFMDSSCRYEELGKNPNPLPVDFF